MNRIGFLFSISLFLATCCIFAFSLNDAAAVCGTATADWRDQPTNETANGSRVFDTTVSPGNVELQLNWTFPDTPFIGEAEIAASGNENIQDVTYTPAYFFPSTCQGSVAIDVMGTLTSGHTTGTLMSLGKVWDSGNPPPYDDDIHTLSISS